MALYKVTSPTGRYAVVEASSVQEAKALALRKFQEQGSKILEEETLEAVSLEVPRKGH